MNFDAFKSAPWFNKNLRVVIGGLGNIGSWTSLLLARMGYSMYLYDFDTVEDRNIGSQFYGFDDVGRKKEDCMINHIAKISGNYAVSGMGKYTENSLADNIMISAFDNMSARKLMFEKWLNFQTNKKERPKGEVNIFIDGRSLAEGGYVFAVKSMKDAELYKAELFNDNEVEDQVCSFKSTSHNGTMIASLITSVLINHIYNKMLDYPATHPLARPVPFKIDYQLPILMFHS
jgi:hypothetical protein